MFIPVSTQAVCETVPVGPYSKFIHISEVLPNPSTTESADEFIELYNSGAEPVDVTGWKINDAAGTSYTLSGTIGAKRYFTWYRSDTHISLNNSGDSLTLLKPDGKSIETITYSDTASDDTSYALQASGDWAWTTQPTPFTINLFPSVTTNTTDNSSDTTTDQTSPVEPNYDYSEDVILSELLPDPDGSDTTDEWIELWNTGDSIDLYGWTLTDSSNDYTFPEDSVIHSGEYKVIPITDSKISLNNSGETITLKDPADTDIASVTYSTATSGSSYALDGTAWQWSTTPTPGTANSFPAEPTTDDTNTDTTTDTPPPAQTISDIKQLASGESVTFSGTVEVLPETYSSNYFYVQDDTAGIQIYSSSKSFPTLTIGDVVSITGTTSSSAGEAKINTNTSVDITVTSHLDSITPKLVTTLDNTLAGTLVSLTGTVTAKSGSTITLDTGTVYVKRNTGISTSGFTVGQNYTVLGVVVVTDTATQLWPRSSADVIVNSSVGAVTALNMPIVPTAQAATDTVISPPAPVQTQSTTWLWWLGGAALGLISIIQLWRWPWLKSRLRNWYVARVSVWVKQHFPWVDSKRNTMGSDDQSQCHDQHTLDKTTVSTNPPNLPSAIKCVPIPLQSAATGGILPQTVSPNQNTL